MSACLRECVCVCVCVSAMRREGVCVWRRECEAWKGRGEERARRLEGGAIRGRGVERRRACLCECVIACVHACMRACVCVFVWV